MPNLLCLSLNNCRLESLENFPNVPSLIRLEIMDNVFPADHLKHLAGLSSLQSLSLANNQISEYSHLEPLKAIPNLVQLDLSECAVADKADYRKKVFEMLDKLHILDNLDEEGKPFEYSGESDVDDEDEDNQEDFQVDPDQEEEEENLPPQEENPEEANGKPQDPAQPAPVTGLKKTKVE